MNSRISALLPRYECHKEVNAGRITGITFAPDGQRQLVLEQNITVALDAEWFTRHPETSIGGYFVVYDNGHMSYSPAKPFEDGYSRKMTFRTNIVPSPRG